jgi:hypothetical protein
MVFLPRRETGVTQILLFFGWPVLVLLSSAFELQNLDGDGFLIPPWIIVGEFLARTALLGVCLPMIL